MKREVAAAPHRELFTIAVALVAGGIGFSAIIGTWLYFHQTRVFERDTEADRELERSRSALRAIPVLGGKWSYQVENWAVKDQKHMQSGECEIQPDPASRPRSFAFHGTRLKTWDPEDAAPTSCRLHWQSTWCEFTDRGEIRLEYRINLDDEPLEGRAILGVYGRTAKSSILKGEYSLHGLRGDLRTRGTIPFERN